MLRLPIPRPDRLLLDCRSVPPACSHFRSDRAPRHCTRRPGELRVRLLRLPFALVESTGPPRFLENPNVSMPCSWTSVRRCVPGFYSTTIQPCVVLKTSALTARHFAAPSHGLLARCLRFTLSVAGQRARLASGWQPTFAGWASHPLVSIAQFPQLPLLPKRPSFPGAPRRDRPRSARSACARRRHPRAERALSESTAFTRVTRTASRGCTTSTRWTA